MSGKRTAGPELGGSGSKRAKDESSGRLSVNPAYLEGDLLRSLGKVLQEGSESEFYHEHSGASAHSKPFNHCILPCFVREDAHLDKLQGELQELKFAEKNNDLYNFHQSGDLMTASGMYLTALRRLFCDDVLPWMRSASGIELSDTVDLFCSIYEYADTLLCHDDELEGRRIAFILYLVPPWTSEDGGLLEFFDTNKYGQPQDVVKSIIPAWNQFVFFEVNELSFHQVAEVLSKDKTRLSVSGWFHGPILPRPKPYVPPRPELLPYLTTEEDLLYSWINPSYLDIEVQAEIMEKFETESEIQLQGFLLEGQYSAVEEALKTCQVEWVHQGPANKRNYYQANEGSLPDIVRQCMRFFQSEAMFLILSNLTGLKLHKLAEVSDEEEEASDDDSKTRGEHSLSSDSDEDSTKQTEPESTSCCSKEVRMWKHGCYTLLSDTDTEMNNYALDCLLHFGCKSWQPEYGGYVSYVVKEEDEELLTINPASNSLALVYRDTETLRFIKFINNQIKDSPGEKFFDIFFTYQE